VGKSNDDSMAGGATDDCMWGRAGADKISATTTGTTCCGKHRAGRRVDIHLQGPTMQIWDGEELLKTVLRTNAKEVRKRHAAGAS
jgi:hypothetical protein